MELADVINLVTYIVVGGFLLIGGCAGFAYWKYGRDCRGNKMVAEIELNNGHTIRRLTPIENNGRSVKVGEQTYMLAKEVDEGKFPLAEEELAKARTVDEVIGDPKQRPYPIRRWTKYPDVPFFGFRFLQRTVRVETWHENNPEPKRPYYGTIDKNGCFVGALFATASEITSMKAEGFAAGLVGQLEELRASQKTLEKTLANIPNKNVLYGGIGAQLFFGIVSVVLAYVIYTGIDVMITNWGF